MKTRWLAAVLAIACLPGAVRAGVGDPAAKDNALRALSVSDQDIQVTARYGGERVAVSGTVDPGCDVVVQLTSCCRTEKFSRMGKVGPFWMSTGCICFRNVPEMFKVKSTRPIEDILSRKEQLENHIGRRGLEAMLTVNDGGQVELYRNMLITARQAAQYYSFHENAVVCDRGRFSASFFWPAGVSCGCYTVRAFAVRNRSVAGVRSISLRVREVGIEAFISNFARTHGILYGLGAVALAGIVGCLMCLLFDWLGRIGARRTAKARQTSAAS